ncbi:MAG: alginate lyase family protein [Candidatus Latescibacteria bacterium]|nr:alginate lyase family protein [Candidatus Latescibacterota bacterium]
MDPNLRPLYGRKDLEQLKTFDRAAIFEALGSFDDRGLSEEAFVARAADLLDARRVPGLAEARGAAILEAVHLACREASPTPDRVPASPQETRQAEDLLAHRFQFYNEVHQLPEEIDWDFNPGTGHWAHDLNRFSYLQTLTRAFLGAGDPRFGRKAVGLILDWIAKCDFGRAFVGTPYVFGSYLNQAIHCEVWSGCVQQLLPGGMVHPPELLRILKSLHDQLAYLEIVTRGHAGNWPTIGCRGILATLAALPVFRDTDRFAGYCIDALADQIDEQVLPDGVQDELTPHYHSVVINNLLGALRAARGLGRDLAPRTLSPLRKMIHYQQQTLLPDGSAQVAFNDSDPAAVPRVAEALAREKLEEFLSPPERLGPERFPYAGVAFLRQRQDRGDLYLAFDGGPYGRSHQHEDKLGFWLFAYGRSFLVDPGRHLYDRTSASYRPYLVTTRAHSTVMVDDAGQHSAGRPETWVPKAPVPLAWDVKAGEMRASAAYDLGYGPDNAIAVVHRREVVFVGERFWIAFDAMEGDGEHRIESRFQFAPCALRVDGTRARTGFEDANLLLWALPSAPFTDVHVEEARENPRGGWYSSGYGQIEPAPCLSLSTAVRLPFFAATLLFPYRGPTPPPVTFEVQGKTALVETPEMGRVSVTSALEER